MADEERPSGADPFDMRSAAEGDVGEELRRKRALMCEKYYLTFTGPIGAEVFADMKKRAFFEHPTVFGNAPQHIRDMREGMRMFMLETQSFIVRHERGTEKQPTQKVAISDTAEEKREN